MLLKTPNQELLARLLAAEKQKRKIGITMSSNPRSALVAALLAQSQGLLAPTDPIGGFGELGENIFEVLKKRRKKKPDRKAIPQFEVDPSGLGLLRSN